MAARRTARTATNAIPTGIDAGDILRMPSYMRNHIYLSNGAGKYTTFKTYFERDGLESLDEYSVLFHNPSISNVNHMARVHKLHAKSAVSKPNGEPTCELCARTLRVAAGIPDAKFDTRHPAYTLLLFNHKNREVFVCADCASSDSFRTDIIAKIADAWPNTIASDGRDVYGLVSALFQMHAITDANGLRPYAIHNISTKPDNALCIGNVPQSFTWPVQTHTTRLDTIAERETQRELREVAKAKAKAERVAKVKAEREAKAKAKADAKAKAKTNDK